MRRLIELIKRHRHTKWALADQSVVSGSNFVTGILLARFLGPESFGIFVVLQSIVLYVNSFQSALIFQPMMSAAPQLADTQRNHYLQGVFALQLVLCGVLSLIIGIAALVIYAFDLYAEFGIDAHIVAALIAAMLAFQLQDWQRRYYFVQEKAGSAFIVDVISYGGQVALLGIAYVSDMLDVATAFWIIAGASSAAFAAGFLHDRLQPVFVHARSVLREGWRTGRDYLAAWQFQWVGTQGVLMFGAGIVGAEGVGGIRAAQNIVGPINILFLAMENVVPVVAARRFGHSGLPGLLSYLGRITTFGSALLIPVLVLLAIFATPIMHLLYGDLYVGASVLVIWQVANIFLQFYLRQTFFFLRTVTATGVIIRAGIVMSITAIVVALLTVHQYHEHAIMAALLCGTAAGLVYSFAASLRIARRLTRNAPNAPDDESGHINRVRYGN